VLYYTNVELRVAKFGSFRESFQIGAFIKNNWLAILHDWIQENHFKEHFRITQVVKRQLLPPETYVPSRRYKNLKESRSFFSTPLIFLLALFFFFSVFGRLK